MFPISFESEKKRARGGARFTSIRALAMSFFLLLLVAQAVRARIVEGERVDLGLGTGLVYAAAMGDVNADGALDLVTIDEAGELRVWLNDGSAAFSRATYDGPEMLGEALGAPAQAVLGDTDGDGMLDLVVVDRDEGSRARVFRGLGGGRFATAEPNSVLVDGSGACWVVLADLDGDGDLDAASACTGRSEWLPTRNRGPGLGFDSLQVDGFPAFSPGPLSLAAADLVGSSLPDVVAGPYPDGTVRLHESVGAGFEFEAPVTLLSGVNSSAEMARVDACGGTVMVSERHPHDAGGGGGGGRVVLVDPAGSAAPAELNLAEALGPGVDARVEYAFFATLYGKCDIVVVLSDANVTGGGLARKRIAFFTGADREFNMVTLFLTARAEFFLVGDTDGDGQMDLTVLANSKSFEVELLPHASPLVALGPQVTLGEAGVVLVVADFDGDGHEDVAVLGTTGGLLVYLSNSGEGEFAAPLPSLSLGPGASRVAAVDADGDGALDLLVQLDAGGGVSELRVYIGHGDGTFENQASAPVFSTASGSSIDDWQTGRIDSDSLADIVVCVNQPPAVYVLFGGGQACGADERGCFRNTTLVATRGLNGMSASVLGFFAAVGPVRSARGTSTSAMGDIVIAEVFAIDGNPQLLWVDGADVVRVAAGSLSFSDIFVRPASTVQCSRGRLRVANFGGILGDPGANMDVACLSGAVRVIRNLGDGLFSGARRTIIDVVGADIVD